VHTLKTIDGKLYITGGFDQLIIDGVTTDAGSILSFDGTSIDTLAGGVEGEIEAIIEYENGILVAGNFLQQVVFRQKILLFTNILIFL
jgi:hypothetical protein